MTACQGLEFVRGRPEHRVCRQVATAVRRHILEHSINESDGAHWAGKAIWYEPRNDQERHGLPCSAAKHEYDEHATASAIAASNNDKPAATMNGGQPIDLIAGAGG
jgi:hypothetical protein